MPDELWTARQFSRNLDLDERYVGKILAGIPAQILGARHVWPIKEGCEALFADMLGVNLPSNPAELPPRDRLFHYRAERHRVALAGEVKNLIPATEVRAMARAAFAAIEPVAATIPPALAAVVSAEAAVLAQKLVDDSMDGLHARLSHFDRP